MSAAIQHRIRGHNNEEPSDGPALAGTGMKFQLSFIIRKCK